MKKLILAILFIVILIVFVRLSFYTVDASEYVYVTVLGHHPEWGTHDGADQQNGAGLKFGWPWPIQKVQRIDRRLQQFDLRAFDQLTHDPKGKRIDKILSIEAYVCWKIADRDAVDRFVRRIGTADRARAILEPRINSQLGAIIGQKRMDDLVSTSDDPKTGRKMVDVEAEAIRELLLANLGEQVRDEYGITLIDIRLRRFNHPANVRESIFQRIRSERNTIVAEHDNQGKLKASNIASETEANVRDMLAKARSAEEKIKADADTEAMMIRNMAYSQNPEFYDFLKKLDTWQNILGDSKTMLLLSTHRSLFESMFQPPRAQPVPAKETKAKKGDK